MESDSNPYLNEALQLYKALFDTECPVAVKDLYASANAALEGTWCFDQKEIEWLEKTLKFNICLAELAWLAKNQKSNPNDILWVKMHSMLYLTELTGSPWAHRSNKTTMIWFRFVAEVLVKPLKVAVARLRLWINV